MGREFRRAEGTMFFFSQEKTPIWPNQNTYFQRRLARPRPRDSLYREHERSGYGEADGSTD